MTVAELIEELQKIEDKSSRIQVYNNWSDDWNDEIDIDDIGGLVRLS